VLLGHSERRIFFDETDDDINAKLLIALSSGLGVVLCIGESEREYEMGLLAAVCAVQLKKGLRGVLASSMDQIIIAYEPVWAIGTGKTATPLQAQEAHVLIRAVLAELYGGELARKVRIQYGGSVTPESVDDLMRMPDVDGALVGGASLVADKLSRIIEFTPPDRPLSNPRQLVAREVVACKNALGESPVWSARERMLYWISAVEREVWAWNLRDSPFKRTFESTVGSIALVDDGRLLVSCDDRTLAYDVETGASKVVARTPEPHRLTRFNDGRVDRAGQLVIGMYNHFHRGGGSSAGDDNAGLYRLSAGGFDELGPKFRVSNVICFSPDGRTLYFCDSPTRKVYAYSYSSNTSPALADRRLVYTMPSHLAGSPDGAQVDAAGGLWIALSGAGQVAQIDPETGETKMVVLLPVASPTSLTFGGDELDTLYITSRGPDGGGLYAVQMPFGVRGIAEPAVSREMVERLISSAALAAAD
jgi:sugar lactone lactonase YvrE